MFRVTTQANFDGLVCAALLSIVEDVDRYRFVQPKPFQDGEGAVISEDVLANLPYRDGCAIWFNNDAKFVTQKPFRGASWIAPSAARIVFEYYNYDGMLDDYAELVDIVDLLALNDESILLNRPYLRRWNALKKTIIAGNSADESYWLRLIQLCVKNNLDGVMKDELVKARVNLF